MNAILLIIIFILFIRFNSVEDFNYKDNISDNELSIHVGIKDENNEDISLIGTSDGKLFTIGKDGTVKWETSVGSLKSFNIDLKVSIYIT